MKQHFDWFQDQFTFMHLADIGLVDLRKFQECFDRLAMGVPVPLPEFHQTLSLEMWIRQKEEKYEINHPRICKDPTL